MTKQKRLIIMNSFLTNRVLSVHNGEGRVFVISSSVQILIISRIIAKVLTRHDGEGGEGLCDLLSSKDVGEVLPGHDGEGWEDLGDFLSSAYVDDL